MLRPNVILLIACLASFCGASIAEAQVESKTQHRIGAHRQSLATCVSILLNNEVPSDTLLSSQECVAWIQTGKLPSYQVMNQRAIRLRSCSIYLYQADEPAPDDSLWRERLSSHGVRLVEIAGDTSNDDLLSLATELSGLFPEKRETIAENLSRELERRRRAIDHVDLAQYQSE